MKRLSVLFMSLIMITAVCLSGCGEIDRYEELSQLLNENEESLSSTFTEEACSFEMFAEYMKSWSKSSKAEVAYTGEHSIALVNPASEKCGSEPSTTLLCNVKTDDIQSSLKTIATASTALLGPENHGKTVLVVTEVKDGRFLGMEEIPYKYFKSDNLINLQSSKGNTILISGPRSAECTFHKSGRKTESQYSKAYEIRFTMPEYTDPFDFVKESNYPNPVNTIGGLLASTQSSGKLFDIASFTSESHDGYTPYSATAVIVIDANHAESFTKKFDNSYESIADKFEKLDSDFVYTCNETELPENVLNEKLSDNLISLMYTLNTGICMQDEDTGVIYASSYISSISTENSNLDLTISLRTRGQSYLDSISTEYETTAGLCSTGYKCTNKGFVWKSNDDSEMVEYFTEKVPLAEGESDISLRTYENDFVYKEMPEQNMIIYTFDSGDRQVVLENIARFMSADKGDH